MDIGLFVLVFIVGFFAQILDGALGMGYGVISSSFLLVSGTPPVLVSSSVVISKMFTNGASGLSHLRFGNVDTRLIKSLIPAGIAGGIVGVLLITSLPEGVARPFVATYLMLAGIWIIFKGLRGGALRQQPERATHMAAIGGAGGFFDAIGGGGWGPVVTTSLVARGNNPRLAIGSAAAAEFFVAITTSMTFFTRLTSFIQIEIILGLIVGGVLGAPIAAWVCGRVPPRIMMIAIGILIVMISLSILL